MPRSVLILSERFHPEDFRVNELAQDWIARGYQVRVLTQVPSYPQGEVPAGWSNRSQKGELWRGILVDRVRTVTGYASSLKRKLLNYLNFMLRASWQALLVRPRPSIIFSFQTGPLTSAFPAALAGWLRGIPVIIWTQDLWPESVYAYGFKRSWWLRTLLDVFVSFVYKRCDLVLVSCKGFARELKPYVSSGSEIRYVPNWAQELDLNQEAVSLSPDRKRQFTFAGNIGKLQNLDKLLDAWKGLPRELLEQSQFNLIGDGSHLDALKKRVKDEGIPALRFWGRISPENMGGFYKSSDVLVLALEDSPLFKLTIPSKFQTYLAAGKAVLAAVGGEVNQLVHDNGIGWTAAPGDTDAICECFRQAIEADPEELTSLMAKSRKLHEEAFLRESTLETLHDCLQRMPGNTDHA